MMLAVGWAEGLSGELAEVIGAGGVVGEGGGDQDAVLGVDADHAPIKGGVQGWAEGNTVAYMVVARYADGHDVASLHQRRAPGGNYPHPGNGAGEIVDLWH